MPKLFLLLVLALFAFAGSDALSTPASTHLKLSKSEPYQAVQLNIAAKGMLRSSDGTDAVDEERGMTELAAKLKTWAQSFKTWVTNSKLVQMVTAKVQTLAQKKGVAKAEELLKNKGVNVQILYKNKVTPDQLFVALKLDPKLKIIADSPAAWKNNPGLDKFFAYTGYYSKMNAAAKAS